MGNQHKCTITDCDRLASMFPDTDGDLCGDHRAAEIALGRQPERLYPLSELAAMLAEAILEAK